MKNSLCDSGEDLKKILDDHMVTKKFNESVRSSKEEDLINSGMAFLKNNQKVKRVINITNNFKSSRSSLKGQNSRLALQPICNPVQNTAFP